MSSPHRNEALGLLRGMALSLGLDNAEFQAIDWNAMAIHLYAGAHSTVMSLTDAEVDLVLVDAGTRSRLYERLRGCAVRLGIKGAAVERRKNGNRF